MGSINSNETSLHTLSVYNVSSELSSIGWEIYSSFDFNNKKIIGDQFIRATDSVGANIAEGYGRYHYLDRIRFYYNARGSLFEAKHWAQLIVQRKLINNATMTDSYLMLCDKIHALLNGFIKSTFNQRPNS